MDETSVRVAVRVRPLLDSEKKDRCTECVRVVANQPQITFGNDQSYTFDEVFGTCSRQEDLYESCVSNLVDATFEGFNATVLAYGQTASGKTYTMGSSSNLRLAEEEYGIIPRVASHLFDNVQMQEAEDTNSTYRVRIQFLEIYGEEIRDLLEPSNTGKVTIRETPAGGVYVSGAREELVTSADEMLAVLEKGSSGRTTGSTRMNNVSSRSHAIFTILLERTIHYPTNSNSVSTLNDSPETASSIELDNFISAKAAEPEVRKCKFHFVDLAGSERAKRTGAEGIRLREGIDINKGLLALGNVISALGDEQKRGKVHVPYRDSKLTRILQDSLGGNSKTQMICCVSPADVNYQESLSAIKYANRARNIKNKPIVNLDPTAVIISELKSHIKILATELLVFREGKMPPPELSNQISLQMLRDFVDPKHGSLGNSSLLSMENSHKSLLRSHSMEAKSAVSSDLRSKPSHSMATIKLEQEVLVLKSRVEDSDQEILRLSEKIKRYQNQMSEVSDQMVILQSERDFYKINLGDSGTSDDESAKKTLTETIATYIREIDSLKVLNAKYKLELTHRDLFPQHQQSFNNYEVEGPDAEITGDLTSVAHVIASSEEQLLKEKKLLERLENGEDSGDSENDIQSQVEQTENMAEKDRLFQKRQKIMTAEVNELSESIQLKEQLVIQLQRSQKQYETMQLFYEEKLKALCHEMETKEDEKKKLECELLELSLVKEVEAIKLGREDELKHLLREKENELNKLRKRQQELSHLSHIQSRSTDQLRKLQEDITSMKKQRVDLAKKLQSEKKLHLVALNTKAKEIDKLKRELTRAMAKVQQLGKEKQQVELKFRVTLKDRENSQKKKRVSDQANSSPHESPNRTATTRDSRRWNKSGRPLSEEEQRTKKWLDKHVKVIADRENAAEELRLQYEQQLFLAHQKKQLEDVREPIRSLIVRSKRESSDERVNEVCLSPEEEEVLADVEEKINRLEGQLKFRNEEIFRIEKRLKGGQSSHDKTVEILQQNAAKNLPAAHQLIRLLFDMLVSTRKIARANKENIDLCRGRETRLNEELEEAQARITTLMRIHDKEVARIERDFEEKLAGLFNHTQLSQVLALDGREVVSLTPADSFEDLEHAAIRPRYLRNSISTSGDDLANAQGDERYKTLAALSHERVVALKSHLAREESRCRDLERSIDDYLIERKEMKEQFDLKVRENKFLDDECRMLRDMVQDLKSRGKSLDGDTAKQMLGEVPENDDDSDSSYDESVILDSAVLADLSSLGDEISRTGSVRYIDQKNQNDIFERLANPSNFTGTQKTIFEGDLESNRAKVQQIKEGSLANKKKRGDSKSAANCSLEDGENGELEEFPQTIVKEELVIQPELQIDVVAPQREELVDTRVSTSTPRRSTFEPPQSPDNVFSRLLNPSKFTGIHRRRRDADNLDLPHSSHGFLSSDGSKNRKMKSTGTRTSPTGKLSNSVDSGSDSKLVSRDDFQLPVSSSDYNSQSESLTRKAVDRHRSEQNVFTRLHRKVSDGISRSKNPAHASSRGPVSQAVNSKVDASTSAKH